MFTQDTLLMYLDSGHPIVQDRPGKDTLKIRTPYHPIIQDKSSERYIGGTANSEYKTPV